MSRKQSKMTVKHARETAGKISTGNTKMPGTTYAIDAFACKTGSKLANVKGTPCASCYARKLQKLRPSVDKGWKANLSKWNERESTDHWVQAIAYQIIRYNTDGYHRWFDSGDLQDTDMLKAIIDVCRMTPNVKHWLPTQERGIVIEVSKTVPIPENLIIRVSAPKVDKPIMGKLRMFEHTSDVITDDLWATDHICPARSQGNQCGDCRSCWDKSVKNVSYWKH